MEFMEIMKEIVKDRNELDTAAAAFDSIIKFGRDKAEVYKEFISVERFEALVAIANAERKLIEKIDTVLRFKRDHDLTLALQDLEIAYGEKAAVIIALRKAL